MEDRDTRLRRLKMRSWRRGTKEMDLVLGRFWDDDGSSLNSADLDLYEALLAENDQDLYQWVSGQAPAPARFAAMIDRVMARQK
ncbi:MAG: succinate dehydrogenase assembly factor 2 [Silicimonas sp.]|nr:succinate dehydrogenase assembly factor 2 [Silicimonas sp.]